MKRMKFPLLVLGLALVIVSCRKEVIKNLKGTESIVYITEHDSTVNFSNFQNFKVADSVSVIQDGQLQRRAYTAYDSSLIASVRQAMIQRGFQPETTPGVTPDIGINISRISTAYTGVISYTDYYGYYDNYWDPYYWGYGGYQYYFPYTFGTYSFQEGALSIDMIDLKNPDAADNRLRTIWTGLARGTGIFNSANINEIVQALFGQSPYIQ